MVLRRFWTELLGFGTYLLRSESEQAQANQRKPRVDCCFVVLH